jgi:UDP-glucose 4-epimerase
MNVLITGGAGFIGSHLADRLLGQGHHVTAVDDLSTGSIENLNAARENDRFRFIRASIRDQDLMVSLFDRCDIVFHLAAAVGVRLIVEKPVHTIETNIHGSEVVLNLAGKFGCKVILASTSEVYGKSTSVPFAESDDTVLGSTVYTRWSYACSKMVDEFLALAYRDQFGLPVVICRFFNTVGPRQTGQYGMVVPRFVRRALQNQALEIHGSGEQSRCFCHVSDVVDALCGLAQSPQAEGEVVNIGTDESVTIGQLARKVVQRTGSDSEIRHISYEEAFGRPFDDMQIRMPDLTKIRTLIGYQPKYSLDQTLDEIIEYEKERSSS